ncbi:uncharacterized protein TRIADDRAFT_63890 [Trichoplax adhaerens]|uniref:Alpha-mannosidase n=1 Tax=Trichoplax adhaerens TaxID=10228 RepID=B3RW05_TRIAD|nr:hypothetical protein TRIADDRAFT_63890 [Trichoplax adhaerens]EDV26091.1 hypothetical protein TRIADDRAFT_63890 [Trichoplax adhaerens]|eukprot:XP_002112124.1 hypothetical protein TRIADDRAFT_63890 [Trichoplax adhaerens]
MACKRFLASVLCWMAIFACFNLVQCDQLEKQWKFDANNKLNIHLVSHTHNDVGWLKTLDQYYYGAKDKVAHAGVQYILDTVVQELMADPSKKFIYVEIAFFTRWWREQDKKTRENVKMLVKQGRLEFINGGWSMNDEAATHYNAIIDQMTLGLKFIRDTFGDAARPTIAWHIDPFGHSAAQASLFAQMGFNAFFLGRIDHDDKSARLSKKEMEMIWRASQSLGKKTQLFTGVLYNRYSPPPGFCFDQGCNDPPIQDDKNLRGYNADERVKTFMELVMMQASGYRTNNIMITMGNDFNYENARHWFKNLDKLIKHVKNTHKNVNIFYSTPSVYLKAVHAANLTWQVKTDDFFPYSDCNHCYWTGYFTSRPGYKGYVRDSNSILQVCKQLEVISKSTGNSSSEALTRAMGVAQHHDSVTGTAKQLVDFDYASRLADGRKECKNVISDAIGNLAKKSSSNKAATYVYCDYRNISICSITQKSKSFTINVYNPIARSMSSTIYLPISASHVTVIGPNGKPIHAQVNKNMHYKSQMQYPGQAPYTLVFEATLPALGYSEFYVKTIKSPSFYSSAELAKTIKFDLSNKDIVMENKYLKLTFSNATGRLKSITTKIGKQSKTMDVDQDFLWYNASKGNDESSQASGAYIFRPAVMDPIPIASSDKVEITQITKGSVIQEVHQKFSPWVTQVVRLQENWKFAEFEYTVGSIPIGDRLGKEIISRFTSQIKSAGLYYTDANGREMQKRKRNYRPTWKLRSTEPASQNYYPVNSRMYIKDNSMQLTVLTDRSQGGASLKDGQMELMVHRRLLYDDARGVGEPLNEKGVTGKGLIIRGVHYLTLAPPSDSAKLHREQGEALLLRPYVSFSNSYSSLQSWMSNSNAQMSAITKGLPENVHLLTLQRFDNNILLRLEHQFAVKEDSKLSKPVTVSLKNLFKSFNITSISEVTLSANAEIGQVKPLQWKTHDTSSDKLNLEKVIAENLNIDLKAMQIRTFNVTFTRYN